MIKDNRKLQLFVNKEIIVSGGSVGSPTLLMLSGVGPKEHLTKIKVYLLILLVFSELYFLSCRMITKS
jgi:choline dehydrogenase-like flavoprotein